MSRQTSAAFRKFVGANSDLSTLSFLSPGLQTAALRLTKRPMDFIEQLFGIAPDGGSGTLEFLLLGAPLVALAVRRVVQWCWRLRPPSL